MRRGKLLLAALLAGLVLGLPAQGAALEMLSLSDVRCDGFTLTGTGLPANATLPVSVSEELDSPIVKKVTVRTDAKGQFTTRLKVSLAGMEEVYVAAWTPTGSRRMVMGEHEFAAACPLPFTGPGRTAAWLAAGAGLLAVGLVFSLRFAYQGRHARTVPAPRHARP